MEAMDVSNPRPDATAEASAQPDAQPDVSSQPDVAGTPMRPRSPTLRAMTSSRPRMLHPMEARPRVLANPPVETSYARRSHGPYRGTWDGTKVWNISGLTFIRGGTLTVRPGTKVTGLDMGAAVIITRGARIDAQGTRAQPIVFTSANPAGMRRQGDWAGLVLLGAAPMT